MIIKQIKLNNIRSHTRTCINFSNGITVLSGRTGCGKSTIFMGLSYSLFGADTNLTNNSLLRRGSSKGFVQLNFNNNGHEYEVMRGMKRSGNRVITDPDRLWIKEDGVMIPIISRSNEVNEKILEILNYPSDVKPKELFEITSYAKQDEIRKLIDLTNSEREKYIDRVLQLSKYELTYEHMKQLINKLSNELSLLKGRSEGLERIEAEISEKEIELKNFDQDFKKTVKELKKSEQELIKVKENHERLKKQLNELELIKSNYDKKKGLLNGFAEELKKVRNELKSLKDPGKCILEELVSKEVELKTSLASLVNEVQRLSNEVEDFSKLKGKCPVCHQIVNESHANQFKQEANSKIKRLNLKKLEIENKLSNLKEQILLEQKKKELIQELKNKKQRINDLTEKINYLEKDVAEIKPKDFELVRKEFDKVNEFFIKINSDNSVLLEKKRNLELNIKRLNNELKSEKEEFKKVKESRAKALKLEVKVNLLNKLRNDIRGIRSSVRTKFLEDFRHEFQRKFEDIRKDDNYSVEINNNYEPLAYAGNEETSINALSGGEKTSVALAYRLALSEIAASVSSVDHNEVLLLDEPTTGFDRRDLSTLPQALRAIRTIPQIIIVSHEDELKEAADFKLDFKKQGNTTEINV